MKKPRQTGTRHLKPATRRWVRDVLETWELDEHHRRLLIVAAESWDRAAEARKAIDRDGAVYLDRFQQPKMRPECLVERDAKILFMKSIRELDLDTTPAAPERSRPPALRSIRGGR